MSSNTYSRFFTPQTIALLFCLHQVAKDPSEINPKNQLIAYLVNKILKIPQSAQLFKNQQQFTNDLQRNSGDLRFVKRFLDTISKIKCFNDFYRQLANILKTLRTLRTTKLQQGNLVDFLIRRMYIYFQKLDFKQIVTIYEHFMKFNMIEIKSNQILDKQLKMHEFMLTKSIEQVKFNLENYSTTNPQELEKRIKELQQSDTSFKASYLKGLLYAQQKNPISSIDSMHRYFDKSLGNLFQEKIENQAASNKINHCILSMAYGSLEMGQLDQCLQEISQGLRISQNNSDQQSINNCIIYFYKIAQQLGKYRQQILLAEHAITHSLNLNNLMLMLFSCLSYSYFQKYHDCNDPALMILKSRHISWTQALHFAKKKIYSSFENNCKNIYHAHRNLLIPTFIHKLTVLLHIPNLSSLLLNPLYDKTQLKQLQIFKQFKRESKTWQFLNKCKLYKKMGQKKMLGKAIQQLTKLQKKAITPIQIIKIKEFKNEVKVEENRLVQALQSIQKTLNFCNQYGFTKQQYMNEMALLIKVLIKSQLYLDALIKTQVLQRAAKKYNLVQQTNSSLILRAKALIYLERFQQAAQILSFIENSSFTINSTNQLKGSFLEVKLLFNNEVVRRISHEDFRQECNNFYEEQVKMIDQLVRLWIDENSLTKIYEILQYAKGKAMLLPLKLQKKAKITITEQYARKCLGVLGEQQQKTSKEQILAKKVCEKIKKLYF